MDRIAAARAVFDNDRFASEATGVEIVEVEDRYARCQVTVADRHRNAMGAVMGGVLFTLADLAFAVAANSETLAEGKLHWVSIDSHIAFLTNTRNGILTATARCIRQGRSSCVYTIDVADCEGKVLAVVTTTGMKT